MRPNTLFSLFLHENGYVNDRKTPGEIALEQYDRATNNGIVFEWITFDEGYGSKPEFLRQLDARKDD